MSKESATKLIVTLSLCAGAAWFGTRFTVGEWYRELAKPAWTPPDAVFPPVWTVLYTMMAVSAWLVWRKRSLSASAMPLALFVIQLGFNALWSWLFFGLRQPGLAFADIVVLWVMLVATVLAFWRVSRPAGLLLIPYLLWVTFAAALNFAIWQLNL